MIFIDDRPVFENVTISGCLNAQCHDLAFWVAPWEFFFFFLSLVGLHILPWKSTAILHPTGTASVTIDDNLISSPTDIRSFLRFFVEVIMQPLQITEKVFVFTSP